MTRKDYILLAEAFRIQYAHAKPESESKTTWRPQYATGFLDGVYESAKEIADSLQRDNARFNLEHFLAVVRGEKDLHSRPSRNGGAS